MAQKCFIDRSGMYNSPEIEEARLKFEKRERRKRAVYLTSGILFAYIVLKVVIGIGIGPIPSSAVERFIRGEMLGIGAIAGYILIGIVAYLLCRHDWRTWWQNIHSHAVLLDTEGGENGDSYRVAWRYGIKILLAVCIGLILMGAILFLFGVRLNAVTLNPASLSLLIIAIPLMVLVSFTGAGQRLIRILSWMFSRWADVKMRSIRYRSRTYSHITPKRKLQFMGAMVLFFCNISPIFIESLWDPGMTNFLQSNQYGNQLLTSSSAGYSPLGGPTNLFLEARLGYSVVNESNGWYSLPYNGETWWAHSFSANGSSYMIIEVEGVTSFNITLIYPDLERFNYTVSVGVNQFSAARERLLCSHPLR